MRAWRCAAVLVILALLGSCQKPPDRGEVVFQLDRDQLVDDQLEAYVQPMADALKSAQPTIHFIGTGVADGAVRVRLLDPADLPRAHAALAGLGISVLQDEPNATIAARLSPTAADALAAGAGQAAMSVLQHRLGVRAASVSLRGSDIVVVVADRTAMASVIRTSTPRGLLTFQMVDEVSAEDLATGVVPFDDVVAGPYPGVGRQSEVVRRRPDLTGHIARARGRFDENRGEWVMAFELDDVGKHAFCRITSDNVGKRFAVLIDGQVLTAPRINEPICGGSGQIEGDFTAETASEFAALLEGGALPAQLKVVSQRTLDPH